MRDGRILTCALVGLAAIACDRTPPPTAQVEAPPVYVTAAIAKDVQGFDEFSGRVQAIETVELRSQVTGYLESVAFQDGSEVKKGQLLFQVDPRPYQVQLKTGEGQLERAKAKHAYATRDAARLQDLVKDAAASQLELERAIAERDDAAGAITEANAAIEAAKLNLTYAAITSPIDGRTSRPLVTPGNLISQDTKLTTIISQQAMYAYFDVDEASLRRYQAVVRQRGKTERTVRDVNYPILLSRTGAEADFTYRGVLDFVDNRVDPSTGTIQARAVFANDDRMLVPGEFVRVRLPHAQQAQMVLVPDRCVGRNQDRRYVVVVGEKELAEYRDVTVGGLFEGMRAVTSGVKAGELVITEGLQRARHGKPVKPQTPARPATQMSSR